MNKPLTGLDTRPTKSRLHDLLTAALVLAVAGLLFWAFPASAQDKAAGAARPDKAVLAGDPHDRFECAQHGRPEADRPALSARGAAFAHQHPFNHRSRT